MWDKIYEKQPLATLHIYSDINGKWVNNVAPEQIQAIKVLLENYNQRENHLGIFYHGWVDKKTLADSWLTADIWFYPCIFMETFCLTALEAALTKTLPITNDLAALQNTVSNRGVVINGNAMDIEWQQKALEQIFYYIDPLNIDKKNELIQTNFNWASNLSWQNQANKLLNLYILPNNKLEYKQMYNWTNNLPNKQETEIFMKSIDFFNTNYATKLNRKIQILEVGTYTGISLINIVKLIPNSQAIGIDKWSNYNDVHNHEINLLEHIESLDVEKSFYKNILVENLNDRIFGIKGDSKEILLNMVTQNEQNFDFIYIDGSHKCIDCYLDIFFSWKLLNKGGMLIVEDYKYNIEDKIQSPFESVNQFLSENNGTYNILYNGYRIFIEKII
jgi:hypothetical protein